MKVRAVCQRCGSEIAIHGSPVWTNLDLGANPVYHCDDCGALVDPADPADKGVLFRDDSWLYYRRIREQFNDMILNFLRKRSPRWVHSNTIFGYVHGFDRDDRISKGSTRTALRWLLGVGKIERKRNEEFSGKRERGDWWRFVK